MPTSPKPAQSTSVRSKSTKSKQRRVVSIAIAGTWSMAAAIGIATLDHRQRRRWPKRLRTDTGVTLDMSAAHPTPLSDGDGLKLDDGKFVLVRATREPTLLAILEDAGAAARLAWLLGRQREPFQIMQAGLVMRARPELVDLAEGMGAIIAEAPRVFEPEAFSVKG